MSKFKSLFFLTVLTAIISVSTQETFSQELHNNSKNGFVKLNNSGGDAPLSVRPRIVLDPAAAVAESANVAGAAAANKALEKSVLISRLERKAFDIVNLKRLEAGLEPLVWSENMAIVARNHSQDMAQFQYFSHAGRNGSMVNDRADLLGFTKWRAIGENIAYNRGYDKPADFACERWMMSLPHKENILNKRWKEAGIGVAISQDGSYYFTQVFLDKK